MSELYRLVIKDGGVQWTPEEVIGDLIDEGVLVPVEGVLLTRAEAANDSGVRAMLDADYWLEVPTMSEDLPTREQYEDEGDHSECLDWCSPSKDVVTAWLNGDLLSRSEAADDPEVRSMVHDSIAAKWAWLNETEVTDDE